MIFASIILWYVSGLGLHWVFLKKHSDELATGITWGTLIVTVIYSTLGPFCLLFWFMIWFDDRMLKDPKFAAKMNSTVRKKRKNSSS